MTVVSSAATRRANALPMLPSPTMPTVSPCSDPAPPGTPDRREDVDERVGVARAGDEHVRVGDKRQCRYARRHAIERGLAVAPVALDLSLDDVDAVGPVDHVDFASSVSDATTAASETARR